MLLWFAGLSVVLVWVVFRDTAIDYRLVVAGALLPDAIDVWRGGPGPAHTLVVAVALLVGVMLATRGRRPARRRWLAVPIGVFCHLVLDGVWTDQQLLWWPIYGARFPDGSLPSLGRPVAVRVAQEAAGLAALVWCWYRFRLSDPTRRDAFVRTGRPGRDLRSPPAP